MRKSRRVTFDRKLDVKSVEIDSIEYPIINISCAGILLDISERRPRLKGADNLHVNINLRNNKVYTEYGTIVRSTVYEMAIEFYQRLPYVLFSDRENFRLVYSEYFEKPPAYMTAGENRYKVLEISHPNIVAIESTNDYAEGDVVFAQIHLVYSDKFSIHGKILCSYEDRVVISLEAAISDAIVTEELGLFRNFPTKYSKMKEEKLRIQSRIIKKKPVNESKGLSFLKSLFR